MTFNDKQDHFTYITHYWTMHDNINPDVGYYEYVSVNTSN